MVMNRTRKSRFKGHILELTEVWTKYCQLCTEMGKEVRPSFKSRRSTLKEKLKNILGKVYEYYVLSRNDDCEKRTVMVPKKFSHTPTANIIEATEENTRE